MTHISKLAEECANYFKSDKSYRRILEEIRKKYKSLGKVSGTVSILKASNEECEALTRFTGVYFQPPTIKFNMKLFSKSLLESKYSEVTVKELIEAYFEEELASNKEDKNNTINEINNFFDSLICTNLDKNSIKWLNEMKINRTYGYRLIMTEYSSNKENASFILEFICKAVEFLILNKEKYRLALFSAQITADPHFFDINQIGGKLLLRALAYIRGIKTPSNAEEISQLYYEFNILSDDISSFTAVYGLIIYNYDGEENKAYKYFREKKEPYLITMSNLSGIKNIEVAKNKVYIVENQGVFSQLCTMIFDKDVSIICTSGQLKTASLVLLDMIYKSGADMYYSGDFDPEGLYIAEKLFLRYKDKLKIWHMSRQDYLELEKTIEISEKRMSLLEKLNSEILLETAHEIKKYKKAAYQELLIQKLSDDINCIM